MRPFAGLLLLPAGLSHQHQRVTARAWVLCLLGQDRLQGDDQEHDQGRDPQKTGLLKCPKCDGKILLKSACCPETNRGGKNEYFFEFYFTNKSCCQLEWMLMSEKVQ